MKKYNIKPNKYVNKYERYRKENLNQECLNYVPEEVLNVAFLPQQIKTYLDPVKTYYEYGLIDIEYYFEEYYNAIAEYNNNIPKNFLPD